MTIDHDRFAEANQPPPAKVTETPEVESEPEWFLLGKVPIEPFLVVDARSGEPLFDVTPAPEGADSYSNELPPAYATVADIHDAFRRRLGRHK